MYAIAIYYQGEFRSYVSMINYKKESWDSSNRPKVFKTLQSVEKCKIQINKYAPNIEFKTFELREFFRE